MKKTLIAAAIAGAMSFSVAAQAAPTVYGNIQIAVDLKNDTTAGDNGSTIGFKGEEAMDGGLTAIYKAEFHAPAGGADVGINDGDQSYIGVKGDFGTVRVGSFDTVSNDFVEDLVYGPEAITVTQDEKFGAGENQQIQFVGDMGGMILGASVQLDGGNQAMQVGVKMPVGDMTVGAAFDTENSGVGAGVEMAMGELTVGAFFTSSDAVDSNIAASAAMNYANGTVYGVFSTTDAATNFGGGATYNITNSLYAYGEINAGDADEMFVGAALSF